MAEFLVDESLRVGAFVGASPPNRPGTSYFLYRGQVRLFTGALELRAVRAHFAYWLILVCIASRPPSNFVFYKTSTTKQYHQPNTTNNYCAPFYRRIFNTTVPDIPTLGNNTTQLAGTSTNTAVRLCHRRRHQDRFRPLIFPFLCLFPCLSASIHLPLIRA